LFSIASSAGSRGGKQYFLKPIRLGNRWRDQFKVNGQSNRQNDFTGSSNQATHISIFGSPTTRKSLPSRNLVTPNIGSAGQTSALFSPEILP
jgi:hypothetical protein